MVCLSVDTQSMSCRLQDLAYVLPTVVASVACAFLTYTQSPKWVAKHLRLVALRPYSQMPWRIPLPGNMFTEQRGGEVGRRLLMCYLVNLLLLM